MRTYVARKLSLDRGALELLGNLSNTLGEVVSSSTLLDEPHLFSRKHQPSKESTQIQTEGVICTK